MANQTRIHLEATQELQPMDFSKNPKALDSQQAISILKEVCTPKKNLFYRLYKSIFKKDVSDKTK